MRPVAGLKPHLQQQLAGACPRHGRRCRCDGPGAEPCAGHAVSLGAGTGSVSGQVLLQAGRQHSAGGGRVFPATQEGAWLPCRNAAACHCRAGVRPSETTFVVQAAGLLFKGSCTSSLLLAPHGHGPPPRLPPFFPQLTEMRTAGLHLPTAPLAQGLLPPGCGVGGFPGPRASTL